MTRQTASRRPQFLAGTALAAALALGGWAAPAAAQGFSGTGTVVGGTAATIAPGNADITINQTEAVINWQVTGAAGATDVAFLPLNNTVTFHETVSFPGSDYTVLNRVFPVTSGPSGPVPLTATINIGGTVNSTFAGKPSGNIWFYSPHGIITSGNASFNVGSLLLTTSDIDQTSGSLYLSQAGGDRIGFLAATDGNAKVQIGQTTTINAAGNNTTSLAGYVGIFAPRIEQGGTVRAGGMVGYAAGEAGTITFNAGLVDILITQGSAETQGNGIVHTGSTGGPSVTAATTRQIEMVAMPKSTALTMLLGGSIGFDAGGAVPDGSAVVLSSGWQPTTTPAQIAQGLGNIQIGNAFISGDPTVWATGTLAIAPDTLSSGVTRFSGLTQFNVGTLLQIDAAARTLVDFTGALQVNPLRQAIGENVRIATAGDPLGSQPAGKIAVAGDLLIDATGQSAFFSIPPAVGADGVGGNVAVFIDKGSLTIGGNFTITAHGLGEAGSTAGGNGIGGSIDVRVSGGGLISGTPTVPPAVPTLVPVAFGADGRGGFGQGDGSSGGTGTGGVITLRDAGGTLAFGVIGLVANGYGATGLGLNPTAGDGLGGQIAVTVAGQAQTWTSLTVDASAFNGDPQAGGQVAGNAIGNLGGAKLQVTGAGRLTVQDLILRNNAWITSGGSSASAGTAGGIDLLVNAGGQLTVSRLASLVATADGSALGNPQVGALLTGGTINATVDGAGSQFNVVSLVGAADATLAGAGTTAGTALGGQIAVGATNAGLLQIAGLGAGLSIGAVAHVGYGQVSASIRGGDARLFTQGGTINAGGVTLKVSAAAIGDGTAYDGTDVGFDARGGTASVQLLAGGSAPGSITAGDIVINAKGEAVSLSVANSDPFGDFNGPFDPSGVISADSGGTGQGGTAQLQVQAGTLTASTVTIHANGLGGSADYTFGPTPLQSGTGIGGQALVDQSGGTATFTNLTLLSEGRGGSFNNSQASDVLAPLAGTGLGGTAQVTLSGGTMTMSSTLAILATAVGGDGSSAASNAASTSATAGGLGDASASLAELMMPPGSTASLTAGSTIVEAAGTGGSGGTGPGFTADGGAAIGGTARLSLADGAFVLGNTSAIATGFGGAGGTGGDATGGTAAFLLVDTVAAPATTRQTGGLVVTATSFGGTGNTANGIATPGTTKLTVRAGRAASALVVNGSLNGLASGVAIPGDGFTGNFGAVPVQVNGDFVVTTSRDINMSVDAGGGVNATGQIQLTSPGAITTIGAGVLSAAQTVRVNAGSSINMGGLSAGTTTLLLASNPVTGLDGPIAVSALSSGGLVTVFGSSVNLTSPGALSFATSAASTGDFAVQAAGNLTVGQIDAPLGLVRLASTGGSVRNTGAVSGNAIQLQAGTNIAADGALNTATTFSATAGGTFVGALALNVPGNTSIDAAGGITVPSLTSGGTTFLRSTGGAVPLTLTSAGAVTLAASSASITAPGALTFASASTTGGALAITTGGLLTLAGPVEGPTIVLRSPDLAITVNGRLGRRGVTTAIQLINTAPLAGTVIGGTGQQGVWSLDAAEAARLFADQSITIVPGATAATSVGTVTIGTLALSYGTANTANLGSGGQFSVSTPGAIRVIGQVALTTSTNADAFSLTGGTIDVITDTGGIALTGAGGALQGTLNLSADAIRVGTAAALSAISGLTDLAAISTRLDANDGVANQAGAVRSGALVVSFNTRFFVQNSGAGTQFDLRRGFAANSLAITTGSARAQIAINGLVGGLAGGLTQRATRINGALAAAGGSFDPLSTINGCTIGRDCSTPPGQIVPPHDTIVGLVGPLGPPSGLLVLPVIQFGDMPLFDSPPLIDEPVTGVGNDDLWEQR